MAGKEGEIVAPDITVKVLVNNSVALISGELEFSFFINQYFKVINLYCSLGNAIAI
ncbi:MAG: hypothetical protein AAFV28_07315 [Cyanobacteria bacterium J06635_13]